MTKAEDGRETRIALLIRLFLTYAGGLSARGLEVIGKFGLYAVAAHRLGAHDSGLFFLCLNWVNIASTASRLGLERATVRHMAAEIGIGRGRAARRAAITSFVTVTCTSLVGAVLTAIAARPAALHLFNQPELARPLVLSAAILPAQTMAWGVAFILTGLSRAGFAQLVLSALPSTLTFLSLLLGVGTADQLLLALACANVLCCILGMAVILRDAGRKLIDFPAHPDQVPEPLPTLWVSARPFFVVEMVQIITLSLPTLVLGVFARPADVSEFSIASRLSNLITTIVISIGAMVAANFAALHRIGAIGRLRQIDRQARWLTFGLCLPVIALMLIFPARVLRLLGSEFGGASHELVVLASGQLINSFWPFQDTLLAMIGAGVTLRRLSLMQFGLCLICTAALIPTGGMMGAALAIAVPFAAYVIGCKLAVGRRLPRGRLDVPLHIPGA